jgi:hypothetical protein
MPSSPSAAAHVTVLLPVTGSGGVRARAAGRCERHCFDRSHSNLNLILTSQTTVSRALAFVEAFWRELRSIKVKLADVQPNDAAAAAAGGGGGGDAQRKRRRVAFEEPAAAGGSSDGDAGAGAGAGRRRVGAGASSGAGGGRRRSEGGGGDGVDFFDDDEEGGAGGGGAGEEVVEEEAGEGFDVDDDDEGGDEREDAGGGADFGARVGKGAGAGAGGGDDDDEGGAGGRVVKKIKRVRGEQGGRLEEEFNEAGQAFEPFNLRAEREDGYFDESGNYHWKKKGADDYDPWLQELDSMDPKARRALQERTAEVAGDDDGGGGEGDDEDGSKGGGGDDDELPPEAPAEDLPPAARVGHLTRLWEAVREGETVSDALRRLGAASRAAAKAAAAGGSSSSGSRKGAPPTAEQASFDGFVEAADALLTNGMVDVYSAGRRDLLLELNDARDDAGLPPVREPTAAGGGAGPPPPPPPGAAVAAAAATAASSAGASAAAVAPPAPQPQPQLDAVTKRWAYKWALDEGTQVHGPFTSAEMAAWAGAGYFAGRQLYVQDTLAAAAPPAAAAAPDDADDDIFGGVGKYVAPPAATPAWVPLESVRF